MKITKAGETTVVEISKKELKEHNLTFEKMNCSEIHTKTVIKEFLCKALGEKSRMQKEILLLPDCDEGCVLVCKEKLKSVFESVSFSTFFSEKSEIFSCFFS